MEVEHFLGDLQTLSPLPTLAEKIEFYERFFTLDQFRMIDCCGLWSLEEISRTSARSESNPFLVLLQKMLPIGVDWDPALKNANRWYDRAVVALRRKERAARQKELEDIEADSRALGKDFVAQGSFAKMILGSATEKGKAVGDYALALFFTPVAKLSIPADKGEQVYANTCTAFALAWYRCDHGRYPKELSELAPKYLKGVQKDIFSGKELIYRPTKDGYLLYSVGVNGQDDYGRGAEDDLPGDDIAVSWPLPGRLNRNEGGETLALCRVNPSTVT